MVGRARGFCFLSSITRTPALTSSTAFLCRHAEAEVANLGNRRKLWLIYPAWGKERKKITRWRKLYSQYKKKLQDEENYILSTKYGTNKKIIREDSSIMACVNITAISNIFTIRRQILWLFMDFIICYLVARRLH